ERRGHPQHLAPVADGLLVAQLGRLGDVAAAPDHDRVPGLPGGPLQVGVAEAPGEHADAPLVLARPPLRAHRAALALETLGPVRRPGRGHPPTPRPGRRPAGPGAARSARAKVAEPDRWREGRAMERVEVDGLQIANERAGGGPPLVLLPGYVSDGPVTWRRQLDGLCDEFTVVARDAPGAGGSSDPPSGSAWPATPTAWPGSSTGSAYAGWAGSLPADVVDQRLGREPP